MLRAVIFACLSLVLAYVSRGSLRAPRSHGFYRFFAWECILGLSCLNFVDLEQWFGDPFALRQFISWFLLIASIVPAVYGVHLLRTLGTPDARRRDDTSLVSIEKTTTLVTTGAFKYIRHPLYSSLLLLAWGVFFKHPSWFGGGAVLGATACLLTAARVEEVENLRCFGAAYRAYIRRTKIFIPFVF